MPPATPTTTRLRSFITVLRPRGTCLRGGLALALGVLEQVAVNLAHGDRQRLLLESRLDERTNVLEDAVAQLVVVVVDLARPLRGEDHQRVLAGCTGQQLVDRRVGDAQRRGLGVGGGGGGGPARGWS